MRYPIVTSVLSDARTGASKYVCCTVLGYEVHRLGRSALTGAFVKVYPGPQRIGFDVELRGDSGNGSVGGIRVALGQQDELYCAFLDVVGVFLGNASILLEWVYIPLLNPGQFMTYWRAVSDSFNSKTISVGGCRPVRQWVSPFVVPKNGETHQCMA
ncbi:hypothetical protein [Glutamicibacter nicotianae]|uniref:hypothetical protein n=1 Tax=Glutamicibacter nicotianae TaxID=37929 RepID=UPI001EF79E12|nr:hypothetical protein [Glutamicibacter nicotianae]MBM7768254.1 hypothetical protein [Glutamicibacter nicotianae]